MPRTWRVPEARVPEGRAPTRSRGPWNLWSRSANGNGEKRPGAPGRAAPTPGSVLITSSPTKEEGEEGGGQARGRRYGKGGERRQGAQQGGGAGASLGGTKRGGSLTASGRPDSAARKPWKPPATLAPADWGGASSTQPPNPWQAGGIRSRTSGLRPILREGQGRVAGLEPGDGNRTPVHRGGWNAADP